MKEIESYIESYLGIGGKNLDTETKSGFESMNKN